MTSQPEKLRPQDTIFGVDQIRVTPLTSKDEPAYTRFLLQDEQALIYATLPFRDFLAEAVGGTPLYLVARRDDAICGVLLCFVRESELGRVINSLPWYGSHAGCRTAGPWARAARAALLTRLRSEASEPAVLSATVIPSPLDSETESYQTHLGPLVCDPRIGQITHLPEWGRACEKQLEATYRQKTRNLVRKSQKQGFEELVTDDAWAWDFLYEMHTESLLALGRRPKPLLHFESLRQRIPSTWRRLSLARLDGRPVAALLLLRFRSTVEYIIPVMRREYRSQQPLSFLIHRAMLEMAERGATLWNWGSTWLSQRSLYHFKAGCGAEDFPYSYLTLASESGVARIRKHRDHLADAFPYYYVYPFSRLDAAEEP